jgi:hypothetical protein
MSAALAGVGAPWRTEDATEHAMPLVRYRFAHALNGVFELPIEIARLHAAPGLEPVEPTAGVGLLAITMFQFDESPVGPYHELVLSLFVAPRLSPQFPHPHAAVQPLLLGSTSELTRRHAIDLWHLPHYAGDVHIEIDGAAAGGALRGLARCGAGAPILELTVHACGTWEPTTQRYQSYQRDDTGSYLGVIDWDCLLSDHEDRRGSLRLFPEHEFFAHERLECLDPSCVDDVPCREMVMQDGVEAYHPLITV